MPNEPEPMALASQPVTDKVGWISPGIRAMAVGAFWFSIMALLVRLAGRRLGSMEIVLMRGLMTLALSWWAIKQVGISPWGTQRKLLVFRGALGSMALLCYFYSLLHLPLGEAALIQNMNPVFATLLAAYVLHEHLRAAEVICLVTSLLGVLLIAHPAPLFGAHAAPVGPIAIVIALGGAFFSGSAYTLVRKMRVTEHPLVIVFYLPLLSIPLSLPFAFVDWKWPNVTEWLLLIGIGIATQLAQVNMTRGLQLERTARATTTGYLQVAFAVVWGAIVLGEIPDVWTLLGATTIISSTLVLSWWNSRVLGQDAA